MSLDCVPISADLIKHVKRLDGFSESEIGSLRYLVLDLAKKEAKIDAAALKDLSKEQEFYLQILLKIHQVLALLDVDWSKAGSTEVHLKEILESLKKHGGLDYLPRERTPAGRSFEHASDSRILLSQILKVESIESADAKNVKTISIQIGDDDNVATEDTLCTLDKNLLNIAIRANGKADLYLHAYAIYHYVCKLNTEGLKKT